MPRALALTTINSAAIPCLGALAAGAAAHGIPFYIAGDTKTPADFSLPGTTYLSIEAQEKQFPALCRLLPKKHYARKNIAYLAAIAHGATEIQETDDDNFPRPSFWKASPAGQVVDVVRGAPWANVYACFTDEHIWPRGLPLEFIHHSRPEASGTHDFSEAPPLLQQGLADDNPDVDAVFRMTRSLPVRFNSRRPVMCAPGSWCPFNSQNTLFHRRLFPLLYLPSHCSFRMTDIWRSFIAQRCLWELGQGVVFHEATVWQERNEHRLLRDFEDEVPGYLLNEKIRAILEPLRLDPADLSANLARCYETLVAEFILPAAELPLVRAWLEALPL